MAGALGGSGVSGSSGSGLASQHRTNYGSVNSQAVTSDEELQQGSVQYDRFIREEVFIDQLDQLSVDEALRAHGGVGNYGEDEQRDDDGSDTPTFGQGRVPPSGAHSHSSDARPRHNSPQKQNSFKHQTASAQQQQSSTSAAAADAGPGSPNRM